MKLTQVRSLILLGASIPLAAFAQATFSLQNHDGFVGLDAPVYDWTGALLSGSNWRVELYGGTAPDSLSPAIGFRSNGRVIIPLWVPGYFSSIRSAQESDLIARGVPAAGWAWLQVRVWDVGLGSSYEEAVARNLGGYGQSALFYAQGGDPTAPPPTPPGPLIGLQSFSVLQITPEPSTWVLLGVGLGGLAGRLLRKRAS